MTDKDYISLEDLDRPIPEPIELKDGPPEDATFYAQLYDLDEDLWNVRVSEGSDSEAAGMEVRVMEVLPKTEGEGWKVSVMAAEDDPGWDSSYTRVDVEDVEEWIYVSEAKRRLRSAVGPIEKCMDMAGDANMKSDLEMALDLIQKHTPDK